MSSLPAGFLPASLKDRPERLTFLTYAAAVSVIMVSIAASQILLATAIGAVLWLWKRRGMKLYWWPPIIWPLLAFCIWTVFTALVSANVLRNLTISKKFFLYLIIPLTPIVLRGKGSVTWVYRGVFATASLLCLVGIAQFAMDPDRGLLDRISGFMGHWMTFSGLLMLVLVALSAFIACRGWRHQRWVVPMIGLLIASLVLSETRNAWLGAVAGILVVLLVGKPRATPLFLALVLALYLVSPRIIKQRLSSGWDLADPNTSNHVELFQTAFRLIRDNPWVGVGPRNVSRAALLYRGSRAWPDWLYQHMHNNILEIAAERGIPGLILWLWLMVQLARDACRVLRESGGFSRGGQSAAGEARLASLAALGALAALLVAGMFEYNFGDSEVLTLFLFMVSAPYSFLTQEDRPVADQALRNTASGL